MEDFLKKYPSIRQIKSEDKTVIVGQIMKQVRESPDEMADILNIVVGKYFQYEMNGLQGGYGSWREDELNHEIMHVQALAWFGHMINTLKYAQVEFNNTGELDIKGMFNLSSSASDQKRNDAHFGKDEFIRFIEAPNMSGKSVYLETLSLLIACVTQTGYGPAEMINMPHFNRILSLARVASRLDRNSSALSSEVQLLKELLAVVTSGETVFVAATVDEPGSTTSKAYGSSMIYMLTMTALKHGQYLALASHDHDVSLVLEKLEKGYIKRHTMDTEITPDNTVKFNYILKPVEEGVKVSSEAIRVARSLGFPEEILQLAEEYKKTTDPSQVIKNPGGIDLNPTKLDLDIKGVKGAVDNAAVFTNMAWFENMTGLTPVILDTTQIVDLPAFLGLSK
jgi:DNA mismatch repair ATPase MutS